MENISLYLNTSLWKPVNTGWEIINRAIFQEKESDRAGKECGVQLKRPGLQGKGVNQALRISRLCSLSHTVVNDLVGYLCLTHPLWRGQLKRAVINQNKLRYSGAWYVSKHRASFQFLSPQQTITDPYSTFFCLLFFQLFESFILITDPSCPYSFWFLFPLPFLSLNLSIKKF